MVCVGAHAPTHTIFRFSNLPGQGKPIDLTDYLNTPEDVRQILEDKQLQYNFLAERRQWISKKK
jgi:hypothetical protein